MAISEELKQRIYKLRPHLIKSIHDKKISDYIEAYKLDNDGSMPTKENIQMFNGILFANKIASKEADEIIKKVILKIEKEIKNEKKKERRKFLVVNTVIFGMILNLSISFILYYLKTIGIDLLGEYNIFNAANFINAVLILLILTGLYVHSFK